MKVVGIVGEYNPFHCGHEYHLERAKAETGAQGSVAVISGNFTQRGEPAFWDKWTRAKAAVEAGVDLVIEIPFVFACNSAEYFAKGGVSLLDSLGIVNYIAFGSENGSLSELREAALFLNNESQDFKTSLQGFLKEGISYPLAREKAVSTIKGPGVAGVLREPNNILAVEYLKELLRLKSSIEPYTIKRKGSGYHERELNNSYPSATAIRQSIASGLEAFDLKGSVPDQAIKTLETPLFNYGDNFFMALKALILRLEAENLEAIVSAGEGLGNRLKHEIRSAESLDDLIYRLGTKRYTYTRIFRLLVHTLVGLYSDNMVEMNRMVENKELYVRVLAFNSTGASLLKDIKQANDSLPIFSKGKPDLRGFENLEPMINFDLRATDIYNSIMGLPIDRYCDEKQSPCFVQV